MTDFAPIKKTYSDTHVLHDAPFVGYRDGVVSAEECDYLIALATGKTQRAKVSLDDDSDITPGRSGSNCWLRYAEDDTVRKIGERIAGMVGIPLENAEAMQVIHYGVDQEYRSHYDAYDLTTVRGQRCCRMGGQRLVTALVYLNDIASGGATRFANLNTEVQAKKGRMALFNNVGEDYNHPHPDSLHAGTPVLAGEKWAFNIWFHARPMKERQDFQQYPGLEKPPIPAASSTPATATATATAKTPAPITHKINRASKLFQQALAQLDPILVRKTAPLCFTYWDTYGNSVLDLSDLADGTRVLRVVERSIVNRLSNKATLAQSLIQHNLESIAPKTYFTIEDALQHQGDPVPIWFVKNRFGTGGKGMSCVSQQDLASTELPANHIIQAGVTDLALFDGRKFTARAYCLIWNHTIYLYQNGFLVVHGREYDANSTDYAVQIDHAGYHSEEGPVQMHQLINYSEYERYWPGIKQLMQSMGALLEPTRLAADSTHYILLGIDVLLREDGSAQLLEINSFPNFIHSHEIIQQVNIPFFSAALRTMLGDESIVLEKIDTIKNGA
ncbi:Tubulin-tyrosine ligase family protein [Marinomonas aquimarina]|uniref:Tubulin-tyrosine ligase family protein n=1 Tax=Marinomonas aquimarina TaxID=295068 RepID=A0A1A8TDB7_9GAMM|nr:2OG-Fe(II) oxygenase [Marinomonas aquimarina]SBS31137.1 Tubulin-tyrosine ligase family protein [Marinomonas aquimarina]